MHFNPRPHCRSGLPGSQSCAQAPSAADHDVQQQIEALIPRLRRYARALVHDPVAADDLVQDCLVRAIAKIQLWQGGTDLRAWLFTILHNEYINRTRRTRRERNHMESERYNSAPMFSPNQSARLELHDLERAIAKLSEEQRAVILLIGLEGMGYEEVAAALSIPVGTVRSRVSRARETLRMLTGRFSNRDCRSSSPAVAHRPAQRLSGNQSRLQPRSLQTSR
jgi:RNA polymerase sigma-70 factor, ECF subfamily